MFEEGGCSSSHCIKGGSMALHSHSACSAFMMSVIGIMETGGTFDAVRSVVYQVIEEVALTL